jgi:hypothetical protein
MEKFRNASELCDRMPFVRQFSKPPNYEEILDEKHLWDLSLNELNINEKLNNFLETNDQNVELSVESILRLRINYKSDN